MTNQSPFSTFRGNIFPKKKISGNATWKILITFQIKRTSQNTFPLLYFMYQSQRQNLQLMPLKRVQNMHLDDHNNTKINVSTLHNVIPFGHTLANSHSTAWKGSSKNCGLQKKKKIIQISIMTIINKR